MSVTTTDNLLSLRQAIIDVVDTLPDTQLTRGLLVDTRQAGATSRVRTSVDEFITAMQQMRPDTVYEQQNTFSWKGLEKGMRRGQEANRQMLADADQDELEAAIQAEIDQLADGRRHDGQVYRCELAFIHDGVGHFVVLRAQWEVDLDARSAQAIDRLNARWR